jgi:hypothetical protein
MLLFLVERASAPVATVQSGRRRQSLGALFVAARERSREADRTRTTQPAAIFVSSVLSVNCQSPIYCTYKALLTKAFCLILKLCGTHGPPVGPPKTLMRAGLGGGPSALATARKTIPILGTAVVVCDPCPSICSWSCSSTISLKDRAHEL